MSQSYRGTNVASVGSSERRSGICAGLALRPSVSLSHESARAHLTGLGGGRGEGRGRGVGERVARGASGGTDTPTLLYNSETTVHVAWK